MPPRPYINKHIDVLEQLFKDAADQISVLKLLQNELRHRRVPRAVALRRRVASAIARHPEGGVPRPPDDELPPPPPGATPKPEEPETETDAHPGDTPDSAEEVNGQSFDGFEEEIITYIRDADQTAPEEPTFLISAI